jgi:mRNA interferase RelE/StbE
MPLAADTATGQLRKPDSLSARHIIDFVDERVAGPDDLRRTGEALAAPLGGFWRYRVRDCRVTRDIQDGALRVLVVRLGNGREVY